MAEGTACPKCGYVRKKEEAAPEWQCPSCQVVYAKAQPEPAFATADVILPEQTVGSLSNDRRLQEMRDNQNLMFGVAAGAAAALVGAVLWAVVTAITNYQIGWMAVGIGALVGVAIRAAGKGVGNSFGYAGAVISLLGCVVGNFLTVVIMISRQESMPIMEILSRVNPQIFAALMKDTFQPMDLLFYALAVSTGYKLSVARVQE
jgi:hypothetical protein